MPTPNWEKWLNVDELKLFEAVALTLNLEPSRLVWDRFDERFEVSAEFDDRLTIAISHSGRGLKLLAYGGDTSRSPVRLNEFVSWASPLWRDIPVELRGVVEQGASLDGNKSIEAAPEMGMKSLSDAHSGPEKIRSPVFSMTKRAMVEKHKHHWPSIEADMKHAAENDLSTAKAGPREWNEAVALEWARANAKFVAEATSSSNLSAGMNSMAALSGRQHRLKG